MNTSGVVDSASTDLFKHLQVQFMRWAASWEGKGDEMPQLHLTLPDVVSLLEVFGFRVYRIDGCPAEETGFLSGGKKGVRTVVTCNHSGQRIVLEQPLDNNDCRCPAKTTDERYWEVVATPSTNQNTSLVETGNYLTPLISIELRSVVRHIINYLLHMMHGTVILNDSNHFAETPVKKTQSGRFSEPYRQTRILSPSRALCTAENVPAPNLLSPSLKLQSPARYRSLDTLTSEQLDSELPAAGSMLQQDPVSKPDRVVLSSPNINLIVEEDDESPSTLGKSRFPKVVPLLREAQAAVDQCLAIMENNKSDNSSAFEENIISVAHNVRKLFSATGKLTINSKRTSSCGANLNLTKPSNLQPKKKKGASCVPTKCSSNTSTETKAECKLKLSRANSASSTAASQLNVPSKAALLIKTKKKMFANVKSTIPKATPYKKT